MHHLAKEREGKDAPSRSLLVPHESSRLPGIARQTKIGGKSGKEVDATVSEGVQLDVGCPVSCAAFLSAHLIPQSPGLFLMAWRLSAAVEVASKASASHPEVQGTTSDTSRSSPEPLPFR